VVGARHLHFRGYDSPPQTSRLGIYCQLEYSHAEMARSTVNVSLTGHLLIGRKRELSFGGRSLADNAAPSPGRTSAISHASAKGEPMGQVVSIHLVRQRNGAAEGVERAVVQTNYGLEGDWRSRRNRAGQLTLIEAEALEEVRQQLGHIVPPGASRRQIVVRGVKLNDLIGQRVRIGTVRVFVEAQCDPCSRMEETIGAGAREALEGRGGVRCHVLAGGELCVGDSIVEEPFQGEVSERAAATPR
jgi:MOSC domain-containing protein YiiM